MLSALAYRRPSPACPHIVYSQYNSQMIFLQQKSDHVVSLFTTLPRPLSSIKVKVCKAHGIWPFLLLLQLLLFLPNMLASLHPPGPPCLVSNSPGTSSQLLYLALHCDTLFFQRFTIWVSPHLPQSLLKVTFSVRLSLFIIL